jgi:hypothetical protein
MDEFPLGAEEHLERSFAGNITCPFRTKSKDFQLWNKSKGMLALPV